MRTCLVTILVVSILPVVVPSAGAQCAPPGWTSLNQYSGPDGIAEASVTWDPDGAGPLPGVFVAGGQFQAAGRAQAANVAAWDGNSWQPFGAGLNGRVRALAVFNGALVAAGDFTASGAAPVANIALWDGAAWQPLGAGMTNAGLPVIAPSTVAALAVFNGELIAAGQFTTAGGVLASHIARWNGVAWQGVGGGITGAGVEALAVFGGAVVAGGSFLSAGAAAAANIAIWNGAAWQGLGSGITGSQGLNTVKCLAVDAGGLICGGTFTIAGGVPVNHIARWGGGVWQALGAGLASGSGYVSVEELAVHSGGLVAGGFFEFAGGIAARAVARWNGAAWQAQGTIEETVTSLAVHGGQLLANARFRWDGSAWPSMEPGWLTGVSAVVNAVIGFRGELIAAGRFSVSGTAGPANIARFDGTSWQRLGAGIPGITPAGYAEVHALAVHNGDLIAGGQFLSAGGVPVNHVARWDGAAWHALGAGTPGLGAPASALAIYNGDLVAGGSFLTAGGATVNGVARWNGTTWSALGTGVSGTVRALAVWNGFLAAGGAFSQAGGVAVSQVALWNGAAWSSPASGTSLQVLALAASGGNLVAGGSFATASGAAANGVAAWDGSAWQPLGAGVGGFLGYIRALVDFGGVLHAGGTFSTAGGIPASGIARWNGSAWQPLGAGLSALPSAFGPQVNALCVLNGGLIAGGDFAIAGASALSPLVARWSSPLPVLAIGQPGGAGTGIVVASGGLVPGREYFDIVSTELCPGGPGSGPIGGLCFTDPAPLLFQLQLPAGAIPFHWIASAPTMTFGPYILPPGLAFEAVCLDATGGILGCISPAVRFTVP